MDDKDRTTLSTFDGEFDSKEELRAFFQFRLARPVPDDLVATLFEIETKLRGRQSDLVTQHDRREISDQEYLERVNAALQTFMVQNRKLLGDSDFNLVYGDAGKFPIDPAIFLSSNRAA